MDAKRREELRKQFDGVGGFVSDVCRHGGPTVDELRALLARDETLEQTKAECREMAQKLFALNGLDMQDTKNIRDRLKALGRD